jgi:predicted RNA-binding protein with TRAM domain
MRINEIITVNIDDLAMGGEGVAHSGGLAVFVPDSVPGDELKVGLVELKKNFARGAIIDIVKPSPDRVASKCLLAKACGGCQWQHISYPTQLKYKTKIVKETLSRLGKLNNIKVSDIIGMDEPWGFRNKIQYPIAGVSGKGSGIRIAVQGGEDSERHFQQTRIFGSVAGRRKRFVQVPESENGFWHRRDDADVRYQRKGDTRGEKSGKRNINDVQERKHKCRRHLPEPELEIHQCDNGGAELDDMGQGLHLRQDERP